MAIISAIREYIAGCPLLHDGAILGVDQLEANTIGYTVDTTPCEPVVQKYTDGSDRRQFLFVFASREKYGTKVLENIANSGFYEDRAEQLARYLSATGRLSDTIPHGHCFQRLCL